MKSFFSIIFFLFIGTFCYAQQVYQIKAGSVRIYNICDKAELILENRTQNINCLMRTPVFRQRQRETQKRNKHWEQVNPIVKRNNYV
ncbi:hypothetical protein FHW36_11431 [Chitinophaga polysaccharea]|uniref:Uncharacterized protein n=1 Tax=Chitinophaga polysaccharea TaxID=1293035 RepID=A0A561P3J3_9BACT|nr:hypothetical protein FHW36_11431 [Chitinophaga polysaccharea]